MNQLFILANASFDGIQLLNSLCNQDYRGFTPLGTGVLK